MHHLLSLFFIRGVGVLFASLTAILSLRVFLATDPVNSATFLGVIGFLAFVPLAQLGIGRPCYAEVRSRYLGKILAPGLVVSFCQLFLTQWAMALLGFVFLSLGVGLAQGYRGEWSALLIFSLGVASLSVCTFQRDLAYALDNESTYESLETVRRLLLVLVYLGIWQQIPLAVMGLIMFLVGLGSFLFLNWLLVCRAIEFGAVEEAINHWHLLKPEILRKAVRYFGFSVNEVLLYNTPLIIFMVYPLPENIIYFGVWSKLFLLLVLPVRIFIDTHMNRVTALYLHSERSQAWYELVRCVLVGVGLVIPVLILMFFWQEALFGWLNVRFMQGDTWVLVSLGLWAGGNVIQHTFGTFTISNGNGFSVAYRMSLISLFSVSGSFTFTYLITQNIGTALTLSGVSYALSSLLYAYHVFLATRAGTDHNRG